MNGRSSTCRLPRRTHYGTTAPQHQWTTGHHHCPQTRDPTVQQRKEAVYGERATTWEEASTPTGGPQWEQAVTPYGVLPAPHQPLTPAP